MLESMFTRSALQAVTILVAMVSENKIWQLNFPQRSPILRPRQCKGLARHQQFYCSLIAKPNKFDHIFFLRGDKGGEFEVFCN